MITCNCGGLDGPHALGEGLCLRELVKQKDNPIYDNGEWIVDGVSITWFTLHQQRLYRYHKDYGVWSRPEDHSSTNSLPDET